MESVARLRAILHNIINAQGSVHGEQELFTLLNDFQPLLAKVFDVGPRSAQEQKELESGKTTINGRSLSVNVEFTRQVVFISQQLNCSERYVAGLLHSIMVENPNITQTDLIEATILEFHERRRHISDCLVFLLQASDAASAGAAPQVYYDLDRFVREYLMPVQDKTLGSLPFKIWKEIENLGNVISTAQNARQCAVSDTVAPSAQGRPPALGLDVLTARCDSLKYERRNLSNALYLISRVGYLPPEEIQRMVEWLPGNPHHSITFYVLATILVALDPVDPDSAGGALRRKLAADKGLVAFMKKKLDPSTEWKELGLKATILLKWTLFLTETRHRDPSLEHQDGFKTEELETQVWNAVQGDAFTYLTRSVAQLQKRGGGYPPSSYAHFLLSSEPEQHLEVPHEDFKPFVLQGFEVLVRSLITHASSELRKIKQRQEDLVLSSTRSDRTRIFRGSTTSRFPPPTTSDSDRSSQPTPRNDIAMLFSFVGLLYSNLPNESALQFWGSGLPESRRTIYQEYVEAQSPKLPSFLQWAVWSTQARDVDMSMALYDMLSGLAKGQQCSELAYNFMARGGSEVIPGSMLPSSPGQSPYNSGPTVSWIVIFGLLESWATPTPTARSPPPQNLGFSQSWQQNPNQSQAQHQHAPQITLGPKDVLLAQSFLRLLATVVTYSVPVRLAISGHAQFRAIPTLVALIPLGVPLELKGALFDTLAAFCEPGAGIAGVEICKAVWTLMERLEVINVRVGSGSGIGMAPVKGVEVELEEVEAVHKMYPATIPFLRLLSTLIHTQKRIPLKDRLADAQPTNTIPDNLGQPYRLPGIGPFASFVVNHVFRRVQSREYLRPSDRWQMDGLSLCFIERCLASYDLESLLAFANSESQLKGEVVVPLLVQPGYEIMKLMLTNSSLQETILKYVVDGVEALDRGYAEEEPYFRSTIVRVLRIVHRVLEIQDIFVDILIPLLSEFDSSAFVGTAYPRSYFTRLDQALSFGPQYVPALAAYVSFPAYPELVLLSIKIVTALTSSSAFGNLATLLDRSSDSDRILAGYKQVLEAETLEDVSSAEDTAEHSTGAGAPDPNGTSDSLAQANRLAVLDLFIQGTEAGRPYPNVAHFFLLGRAGGEAQIQDPHALNARRACIHVILDLLMAGVPDLKGKGKEREARRATQTDPLFITLPPLAERCYRVVYQLCVHSRTSEFSMRYLRTREDFFARQLAAVTFQAPSLEVDQPVQVLYNDGSRVTTTVPTLSSFLRLRSWILDLIALELHVLTSKGHHKSVTDLLQILFGNETVYQDDSDDLEDLYRPFREVGQSHLRIIELLQSLNFDWSDSLTSNPVDMQFFGQLNLMSCIRVDGYGCEIVDKGALLSLLASARRLLHGQGRVMTPAHVEQLAAETTYILESCAVENHRREIRHAVTSAYEAWRRLLDMTLMKCFGGLPHERRESMLFDLLHVLPATLRSANVQEPTAVLLSEAILSCVTKLREDRRHQIIIQSAGADIEAGSLPAERLYALLRSILDGIMDNSRTELVRGNLYATLINYLHLMTASDPDPEAITGSNLSASLSVSMLRGESVLSDSAMSLSLVGQPKRSQNPALTLQTGSLAIMKSVSDRLVSIISRDAIDGPEVWKTVAFMLLDSLVQLSRVEKQHTVLSTLVRHGILSNFVRGLKDSDLQLQSVLKPDPDDLNPLYVFESKMSLLIRIAQTRQGAERLLEARVLPVLAQCDFLDARPEADQSFIDQDSFLPSAIERYHQLFMPTLQLVDAMLASLGHKHATAGNQAMEFLSSHRDTIIILLKNDSDFIPLALVEEFHLLISLCGGVLPVVPQSELLSTTSGFGGIHAAVLSLAAKFVVSGRLTQFVKPRTAAEVQDAAAYAPGYGTNTKFDVNVRHRERMLQQALIAYLGTTSNFTEPEFSLVLSPVTTTPRRDERVSRYHATVPSVADAIEALNDICEDLADTLKQISVLGAELSSREHIRVENLKEFLDLSDADFLEDLDAGQKKSLVCRRVERMMGDAKGIADTLLATMEMLLLLLWRHLVQYSSSEVYHGRRGQSSLAQTQSSMSASLYQSMRFGASVGVGGGGGGSGVGDVKGFREEVNKKLGPVLGRVAGLDLANQDAYPNEWAANAAYLEIMGRRLRDVAEIHGREEGEGEGQGMAS
ncbi:hypothetical protein JAAARDRAFT_38210 [Jaapia argillacea MUCL 33604]|uniref:Nucleoporin Nup186/Nup192/Nup205 n=1 Tax=Jaapia argillacea MUCL 33604 TaxID=933084 RepID=A0A067PI01_9AGAM|nr:hypothetical protein JAAARDRAFT_38210 [Jaapia argillacea MUCL 33604]